MFYFSLIWAIIIYFFNCLLAKKFVVPNPKIALVYISCITVVGVFGEVFIDSVYNFFIGEPLWVYHLLPIHNGYTSYYSLFIWGLYGFHLYLFHENLKGRNIYSEKKMPLIIAVEAITLELLFNISHLWFFGSYIFYYLPNDLWHLTSFVAVPFYFFAGFILIKSLKRFIKDPLFFIIMSYLFAGVLVFMA
jgi:hypothetical protein